MNDSVRLLVCFRWHDVATEPDRYLAAAERVTRRVEAFGGELVAWGADRYTFQFDPRDFRPVLKGLLALLVEANTHALGIAQRDLYWRVDDGTSEQHAWGPALLVADALATTAKPGEILLDPTITAVETGELATLGSIPVRIADERVSAALLLPGTCSADGFRVSSAPGPKSPSSEPAKGSGHPSSEPGRLTRAAESTSSGPPGVMPRRTSMIDELRTGQAGSIESLAGQLRAQKADAGLTERIEALASLAKGDVQASLDTLATGVRQARGAGAAKESRAALAYALGLAVAGKPRQALLEGLSALARARVRQDKKGQCACASFLSQLAAEEGQPEVAQIWKGVAAGVYSSVPPALQTV